MLHLGIDVGSTTIKVVLLDEDKKILYSDYQRHLSLIKEKSAEMLEKVKPFTKDKKVTISISGSAGMGVATECNINFVQEVYATRVAAKEYEPDTDTIIELGGEDAKILFLTNGLEVRMNGTCAGGTGAFIDQMATLLGIGRDEVDYYSKKSKQIYTIASRCGVFAKSDIQPLINQGAKVEDIASSILLAVVNQTIAGLAQGRKIKGKVLYLGGPLTFLSRLRYFFDQELKLTGICPENSLYYVALGAALSPSATQLSISECISLIQSYSGKGNFNQLSPLFNSDTDYKSFVERHNKATVEAMNPKSYVGDAYLGIDSGSTTIKMCLISIDGKLLLTRYSSNNGDPVQAVTSFLKTLYTEFPYIHIRAAASTGYGEDLLKTAFKLDYSLVETQAHFLGAKFFRPDVDFIIDIGGQDIKCFKIRDGAIDDIFLNEACSSGCGSFLQTFAQAMGKSVSEFAGLAIKSKSPVELGSRCTVFMNSSVKQAQKDGSPIEDISAGLAISVVKNAIYKVIRAPGADALGKNIVCQGGTFLNDAVLRAFELEMGRDVIRPNIAGLMGAFGAALYAQKRAIKEDLKSSSILTEEELDEFSHKVTNINCNGCTNHCLLTVNSFRERKMISGNLCERPTLKKNSKALEELNLYKYKQELLYSYLDRESKNKDAKSIGLPLALGMYELLPFYYTLFDELGFNVVVSGKSSRGVYVKGQGSIPSDTVCFPAKLMHGHIELLKEKNVDMIFIPCSSYNVDEEKGNNHYNCPVVAYYGEVIKANQELGNTKLLIPYLSLDNKKHFIKRISETFGLNKGAVKKATEKAFSALEDYHKKVCTKAEELITKARNEHRRIIVLAGRPYHVDEETNHGIDRLLTGLGCCVITEDSISNRVPKDNVNVLNQWTYHARLYDAARYVATQDDMDLVQFVSFGCGLDAVTTDEVREILRKQDKIYTQIKIDEITNVGAVKIRIRSLLAALEDRK